jgi:hypothetical protein
MQHRRAARLWTMRTNSCNLLGMSRSVATTMVCVLVVALALSGCRDGEKAADVDPSDYRTVVAEAEKQTLAVTSVKVTLTSDGESGVAYWQAPNRLRFGGGETPVQINIGNKLYAQQPNAPDRFELTVAPGSSKDIERITNFPVPAIGGLATRARDVTFDGSTYEAVVPVGDKSFIASVRISGRYIVWIRVVTPDTDTTYELSDFNASRAVDEPSAENVVASRRLPSCSAPSTRPSTTGPGILDYVCVVDTTTR